MADVMLALLTALAVAAAFGLGYELSRGLDAWLDARGRGGRP